MKRNERKRYLAYVLTALNCWSVHEIFFPPSRVSSDFFRRSSALPPFHASLIGCTRSDVGLNRTEKSKREKRKKKTKNSDSRDMNVSWLRTDFSLRLCVPFCGARRVVVFEFFLSRFSFFLFLFFPSLFIHLFIFWLALQDRTPPHDVRTRPRKMNEPKSI